MKYKKLLLVDDEVQLVEMLKMRLSAGDYEVNVAYDGVEALKLARADKPDIIILDVMLPKLNGYEVCKILKGEDATKTIPVLILTAKVHGPDIRMAEDMGADDFLAKPFESKELLNKIEALLYEKDIDS